MKSFHLYPAVLIFVSGCADPKSDGKTITSPTGLAYVEVQEGTGPVAKKGDRVYVHYTGRLKDGKQFDSSQGREPIDFMLGFREVIAGWDEGIAGMKVGGKRKLIIPSPLGYGTRGSPPDIPPNAELHFDVELVKIQ